jgi:carbonic anhydrase
VKPSDRLLLSNKSWAQERHSDDPTFFARLSSDQRPKFLWIGCSDSRVPANQITGTEAGEMFVHRNIANLCLATDFSLLSVMQYAIEVLEVEHVIVCGHHGCGGVKAALSRHDMGPISHWLRGIRDVHHRHFEEINALPPEQRPNRLCEWNVREGVATLAKSSIIQAAWKKRKGPWLHGWVYSLEDGILNELTAMEPGTPVHPAYQLDL